MSTRRRVLVVEDELPIRELLRLHLDLAGFEIEEAGDGRDALERARGGKLDRSETYLRGIQTTDPNGP